MCELKHNAFDNTSLKLIKFSHTLAKHVHVFITGFTRESARTLGHVEKIYLATCGFTCNENQLLLKNCAHNLAFIVSAISKKYELVLCSSSSYYQEIVYRSAAILNRPALSNVVDIISKTRFIRTAYMGQMLQHVETCLQPVFLTLKPKLKAHTENTWTQPKLQTKLECINFLAKPHLKLIQYNMNKHFGLSTLTTAEVVIAGGKAFGSKQQFMKYLYPLALKLVALKLKAAIGATRAAIDAGYAPTEWQIGQTGHIIAPKIYIAFGISGSSQHMAGVKDASLILAINTDKHAPIIKQADYTIMTDMFDIISYNSELLCELACRILKAKAICETSKISKQ